MVYRFFTWLRDAFIPLFYSTLLMTFAALFLQRFEGPAIDIFTKAAAKPATDSAVVLVLIDDTSINRLQSVFGPMPWPRTAWVEIANRINKYHAAVVTLDAYFATIRHKGIPGEPESPPAVAIERGLGGPPPGGAPPGGGPPPGLGRKMPQINRGEQTPDLDNLENGLTFDDKTFRAMKDVPNLVVGIKPNFIDDKDISQNPLSPYYYQLNLGVVHSYLREAGVTYGIKPIDKVKYFPGASGTIPALSVTTVYSYLNNRYPDGGWTYKLSNGYFEIAGKEKTYRAPVDENSVINLVWYKLLPDDGSGMRVSHKVIPAWKLFDGDDETLEKELSGKIVMVGSSAGVVRDFQETPMTTRHMGTDVHATAVDNLLNSEGLRIMPTTFNFALSFLLLLVVVAIRLAVRNTGLGALYVLGVMVVYVWADYMIFSRMHTHVLVFTPVFGMVVGLLAASVLGMGMREKQVALLEKNLSQLVSASVLEEIRRRRHSIEASGQRMEITSMFVDIRNFTAQAENLPSQELTDMLNAFYARVVDIVFAHEGTIDKFLGDGILVIFGAPIPDGSHRQKAIACAREIVEKVPEDIGVSLSSGMAFVGFVGPKHKLEYTAVGDVVNLCARLQDYTKQYGVKLIMSETTVEGYAGDAPLKKLDTVTVRGREASIDIYTLE